EAVDPSAALAEARRRLKMMEEEMERERMGLGRRHRKAAGEAVESEQDATDEIDSWRQVVGVLEQLEASNKHRSGKESVEAVDPSAALAEARRRLKMMEEEMERERMGLGRRHRKAAGEAVESEQDATDEIDSWRQVVGVLEQLEASNKHRTGKERFEAVDPSAALAEARRRLKMMEEEMERERMGLGRRHRKAAGEAKWEIAVRAVESEQDATDEIDSWRQVVGVLEQLEASNKHRTGKERFEAVDPSAALAEARRRLKMMEEEMERQRMGLGRRHRKAAGEAVESEQDATDEIDSWRQVVGVLEQLEASNKHRTGKERFEAVDPSAALAEARRRLKMMEEEMERQRMGLGRRHRKAAGEAVESEQDATDEVDSWRQVVGVLEQLEA
ncbi:unnamed protein product, partial [Durusdinium trenchii]